VGPIELSVNDGCEVGIGEGELGDGAQDGIGCSIGLAEGKNVGLIVGAALLGTLDGSLVCAATDGTLLPYVKLGELVRYSGGPVVCSATEGIELGELVGIPDGPGVDSDGSADALVGTRDGKTDGSADAIVGISGVVVGAALISSSDGLPVCAATNDSLGMPVISGAMEGKKLGFCVGAVDGPVVIVGISDGELVSSSVGLGVAATDGVSLG
jgi:hypothetical protein